MESHPEAVALGVDIAAFFAPEAKRSPPAMDLHARRALGLIQGVKMPQKRIMLRFMEHVARNSR
jgi:hypothetical protein